MNVEHFFEVVLAVRLGQLNAADQVTLVFFVQVVGKIEENLKGKKGQIKCESGIWLEDALILEIRVVYLLEI